MTHVERAAPGLAHESKCGNHGGLYGRLELVFVIFGGWVGVFEALGDLGFEGCGARGEFRVGDSHHFRLECIDRRDGWGDALDVALVLGTDEARDYAINYAFDVHTDYWMPRAAC